MGVISKYTDLVFGRLLGGVSVNPDAVSYVSILLSIPVAFVSNPAKIVLLFAILLLDGLDGYFARKMKKNDAIMDYACDRVSELLIFIRSPLLLSIALFNALITALRTKSPRKLIRPLPFRHLYLIWIMASLTIYG